MRIGSLFSGIGGLELGLERAGLGPTEWQVEIDPFCRGVLAKHWPKAWQWIDVRTIRGDELPMVDLMCLGFPCQDVSDASRGRGGGIEGEKSGLWSEARRIIGEIRKPLRRIVTENVAGAAAGKWVPTVRRDLHVLGYRTRALRIDARDVGAPFAGARIFVVAAPYAEGESALAFDEKVARLPPPSGMDWHWRVPVAGPLRMADGIPSGMDRVRALGNAVVPHAAELVGRLIRSAA